MQNQSREALLAKLRKLRAMTTAAGCSEAEANFAAARVAALLAEHNVAESELSIRLDAQGCIQDEFLDFGTGRRAWQTVAFAIARLFQVECWRSNGMEDPLETGIPMAVIKTKFFGFPADVAASIALTAICANAIATETTAWAKANRIRNSSTKLDDFAIGMSSRLCERITVLRSHVGLGQALVVVKTEVVAAEFAKLGLKLSHGRKMQATDAASYYAGQSAAASVDIGGSDRLSGRRAIGHG